MIQPFISSGHSGGDPTELTQWNAFPSDHGSLLFGIATTIAMVRPRLGAAAFAWALIITLSRAYCGLHFLSEVTGAAGLGVAMVCASQLYALRRHCLVFARWAAERPGVFYAGAFVVTYLFATLFDDVRTIGNGLVGLLL